MSKSSKITITHEAGSPKSRMTLGELRSFLDEADRAGIDSDSEVAARVTMSGHLKRIEVFG